MLNLYTHMTSRKVEMHKGPIAFAMSVNERGRYEEGESAILYPADYVTGSGLEFKVSIVQVDDANLRLYVS